VDPNFVLTTARCLLPRIFESPYHDAKVIAGTPNIRNYRRNWGRVLYGVKNVTRHPDFNFVSPSGGFDIGLIELDRNIEHTDTVSTVLFDYTLLRAGMSRIQRIRFG